MAKIPIEDAAFAGVGLVLRKPLAVLAWALVIAAFLAVVITPFAGAISSFLLAVSRSGGKPVPEAVVAVIGSVVGLYVLLLAGGLVVGAVINCAVYRAVLEPENSGFAYLRLGGQELWVMLVNLVRGFVIFVLQIVLTIPVLLVIGVLALNHASGASMVALRLIVQLLTWPVVIWVSLRLSLAGPMSFSERHFRLFESWTMTRGRELPLLAVGIIMVVVSMLIYLVIVALGMVTGVAVWNAGPHANDWAYLSTMSPAGWMERLGGVFVVVAVALFVLTLFLIPIATAPWARIYRALTSDAELPPPGLQSASPT